MKGKEFENQIAATLNGTTYQIEREPALQGFIPDFIVTGPNGSNVIIEAKSWYPDKRNTDRAAHQAKFYEKIPGIDKALVVLPSMEKSDPENGVVAIYDLPDILENHFNLAKTKSIQIPNFPVQARSVFAAMPFGEEYDDTYLVAMTYAAEKVNAACKRVDHEEYSGDIVSEIIRLISQSDAVIIDLSEGKSNVMYEAGYAHALKKPVVHICSTSLNDLPFDVRNWNTIPYAKGQTAKLRETLAKRLNAVLTAH